MAKGQPGRGWQAGRQGKGGGRLEGESGEKWGSIKTLMVENLKLGRRQRGFFKSGEAAGVQAMRGTGARRWGGEVKVKQGSGDRESNSLPPGALQREVPPYLGCAGAR